MKYIGFRKAFDRLNEGARLIKCHTLASPTGAMHYVIPPGVAVTDEIAEKLKAHPQIMSGKDGLFPNMEQTWRHIGHS